MLKTRFQDGFLREDRRCIRTLQSVPYRERVPSGSFLVQGLNPVIFTSLQRNIARLLERNSIKGQEKIQREIVNKKNIHRVLFGISITEGTVLPINFLKKIQLLG